LPEWLIERGIGETRFACVEEHQIVEARILVDGIVPAGTALRASLKRAGKPAVAAVGDWEFLLPNGGAGFNEGEVMTIEVTREQIPGGEPWKRPLAKVSEGDCRSAPMPQGEVLSLPSPEDKLEQVGWSDLLDEARSGIVRFAGGELRVSVTPAMTLIDVDGTLPPADLAEAGARAAVRTIQRHSIGGSIGIDLPTIDGKAARKALDGAIDRSMPQPFERTAMNGFGFIQIVRPRQHASLFELAQDRATFEARALLRRSAFERAGLKTLVAQPGVVAVLQAHRDWTDALSRQVGGAVGLRADPSLTMSGGYAENA